jgi:hypothetical protein
MISTPGDYLSFFTPERMPVDEAPPLRPIDHTERHCSNCMGEAECWRGVSRSGTPDRFRFRQGWNDERFILHMKTVIGGICDSFSHVNPRLRQTLSNSILRQAERTDQPKSEWDEEAN